MKDWFCMISIKNKRMPYWQRRIIEENQKMYNLSIKEQGKILAELYKEQGEKIESKLYKIYVKMLADTKERGEPYINDLFRTKGYHEILAELNKRAKKIGAEQYIITDKALCDAYETSQAVVAEYLPNGPIQGVFGVPTALRTEDVVRTAWCVDGKNFSDRIYQDKDELIKQLYKVIADGLILGYSPEKMGFQINKRLNVSLSNAMRLARTELAHAQNIGQVDKYKEMGYILGRYMSMNDDRTCDECKKLDGNIYTLDELRRMIPQHPNCRDTFTLVMKGAYQL